MPLGNNPDEYSGGDMVGSVMGGGKMDPLTGALITAGSNVLGKALQTPGAGPSSSDSANWFEFDHSGWTVATGGSKADAVAGLAVPAWAWLVIGVVVLAWVKQKKS